MSCESRLSHDFGRLASDYYVLLFADSGLDLSLTDTLIHTLTDTTLTHAHTMTSSISILTNPTTRTSSSGAVLFVYKLYS